MDRKASVDAVVRALRRVNLQGTVFGQSVAIRLGLSDSDVEALETLVDTGASTAGRLAELMGLTTGAVTRLIDRLEQSGYVRRVPDPADRRRVIVEVVPEKVEAVQSMLASLGSAGSDEIGRYTEAQLELIGDFLTRMADVTRAEASRLRETAEPTPGEPTSGQHAAPLGGLTEARLLMRSGASELTLRADPGLSDLYQAHFEGAVPKVRVRDGTVSIQYRGFFDWRKRSADIALNARIPWTVEILGGASRLTGELEGLDLRGLYVTGGASTLALSLGRPTRRVPIRVIGGAGTVRLQRPPNVPITVHLVGGFGRVDLDGTRTGAKGGDTTLETPGAAAATDRFELEIIGGSGKVSVEQRP
jgi:DNA-binding MarR family transcriptional regulator